MWKLDLIFTVDEEDDELATEVAERYQIWITDHGNSSSHTWKWKLASSWQHVAETNVEGKSLCRFCQLKREMIRSYCGTKEYIYWDYFFPFLQSKPQLERSRIRSIWYSKNNKKLWCRTEFINIFDENENRKDVQNNTEAASFD
jgi:hypothetical protein